MATFQEQRGRRARVALVRLREDSWIARIGLNMSQYTAEEDAERGEDVKSFSRKRSQRA